MASIPSTKTLLVPIHFDGLYLDDTLASQAKVQPTLDFSQMPYNDADTFSPFVANSLIRNQNKITLASGLHLHWTLPHALTKSMTLRMVRKSAFEQKLSQAIVKVIWPAMITLKWIRVIPSSPDIGISLLPAERSQDLSKLDQQTQSLLRGYLETINLILDHPSLPPAPNRWLITSFSKADTIEKCWYLESDYRHPQEASVDKQTAGIAFPYFKEVVKEMDGHFDANEGNYLDDNNHRIIGKKYYCNNSLPSSAQLPNTSGAAYLSDPLTALGYGDPNFATFYPNCKNIFGIPTNDAGSTSAPKGESYEIIGWHSDPDLDYYGLFVNDYITQAKGDYISLLKALKNQFLWLVPIAIAQKDLQMTATIGGKKTSAWEHLISIGWLADPQNTGQMTIAPPALDTEVHLAIQFSADEADILKVLNTAIQAQLPTRLVCYARRSINLDGKSPAKIDKTKIEIVAGHTGAEAMAALVAKTGENKLSSIAKHQAQIEDQLAALLYTGKLAGTQTDKGAKLAEARHDKSFIAENGGSIWTIRPIVPGKLTQKQESNSAATLPIVLAGMLNELNIAQQKLDRQGFEIQSTRQQIYLDWCKYQKALYPDPDGTNQKILDYILDDEGNQQGLNSLKQMIAHRSVCIQQLHTAKEKVATQLIANDAFGLSDVNDWAALVRDLQQQAYVLFAGSFPSKLKTYQPNKLTDTQQASILAALNDVIATQTFPLCVAITDLPKDALAIWQERNPDTPFQTFNRMLLESLFMGLNKVPHYILQEKLAPRYWEPRDPVVLFNGLDLTPTTGLTNQQLITCQSLDYTFTKSSHRATGIASLYQAVHPKLTTLQKTLPADSFPFKPQTEYPAQLFMLDWEVNFYQANNQSAHAPDYQTDYIHNNYTLAQNEVDFNLKNSNNISRDAGLLKGRTILSAYANNRLQTALDDFLKTKFKNKNPNKTAKYPYEDFADFLTKNEVIIAYAKGISLSSLDDFIDWCQSRIQLKKSFFQYLSKKGVTVSSQDDYYIQKHLTDFQAWLKTEVGNLYASDYDDLSFNIVIGQLQSQIAEAYHIVIYHFCDHSLANFNVLSQSLGGFHEAMLMKKFAYQLGVFDPCAFEGDGGDKKIRHNHALIRNAVSTQNITSPEVNSDFNPIRAGGLQLNNLVLIDTFGRSLLQMNQDEIMKQMTISSPLTMEGNANYLNLKPRFSQGARLNFRFLSAFDETVEMNDHVATSPICGWLLPNFLDNSLMVYGQDGRALGYVDTNRHWQVYPGNEGPTYPDAIPNKTLAQVVGWLCRDATKPALSHLMNDFMETLANGIEHADPENFEQHQALALLMGRPLAVLKTHLELEIKGQLAISQKVAQITDPKLNKQRSTQGFEQVNFPVRLGEYEQLNDGLIGYWLGEPTEKKVFFAPQTNTVKDGRIQTRATGTDQFNVSVNVAQGPQTLTMIVEPQGSIHATAGILPTKAIQIPPDQYAKALQKIEVAFLTAPLLSPTNQVAISLAQEAGYQWSWLSKTDNHWSEIAQQGKIKSVDLKKDFPKIWMSLWDQLLEKGWLEKNHDGEALIIAADQRTAPLDAIFTPYQAKIEHWLQNHQLFPFISKTTFGDSQTIREGWLRLKSE